MAKIGEARDEITKLSGLSSPHTLVLRGRSVGTIFGDEQTRSDVKQAERSVHERCFRVLQQLDRQLMSMRMKLGSWLVYPVLPGKD